MTSRSQDREMRDLENHLIWLLRGRKYTQRRIGEIAGLSTTAVQQRLLAHFPEHCIICQEGRDIYAL